jgi:phage/plasmid-associated DNA primase
MLQNPGVQPQTAVAFRGNEGTGKSTLGRALMRIAGRHGITVSSSKQLAGNFNAHLRNAVFVFADEALWPGSKESEGTLKQLVTEPVISFEPKGKDVVQGRNLVHLMMASNEEWVVPAGKDARRFAVFDVSDARRNDHAFFDRLNRQLDGGGLAAMLHDLLAIELDGWHPARCVPQTQALAEQKVHSLDPASKFWMEVLDRGSIGNTAEADWLAGPVTLGDERRGIVEEYDTFLKRNRVYSVKATEKAITAAGQALGLRAIKVERNTKRAWVLPPLAEARATFEARVGSTGLFG